MYKEDLALNNLQRLICHKTKPKQATGKCSYERTMNTIPSQLGIK